MFGAETPGQAAQEMCNPALALAKVTFLAWPAFHGAETPQAPPDRMTKVYLQLHFLISTSQKQMEIWKR